MTPPRPLVLLVAACALTALSLLAIAPAQSVDALANNPKHANVCWSAHLTVDTDNNGTWNLGWNIETGPYYVNCLSTLSNMISQANNNGWAYTNAHCFSHSC